MKNESQKKAVAFSGQAETFIHELNELTTRDGVKEFLSAIEAGVQEDPILKHRYFEHGFRPLEWAMDPDSVPADEYLTASWISQPLLFVGALAHAIAEDLFPENGYSLYTGHSQGILAAYVVAMGRDRAMEMALPMVRYLLRQGVRMQEAVGDPVHVVRDGITYTPMLAVMGLAREALEELLGRMPEHTRPSIGLKNAPDRFVLTGMPHQMAAFVDMVESLGKTVPRLSVRYEPLAVSAPFHSPRMAWARKKIDEDLDGMGLTMPGPEALLVPVVSPADGSLLQDHADLHTYLLDIQYTGTVDWVAAMQRVVDEGAGSIVFPGPGQGLFRLTSSFMQGGPVLEGPGTRQKRSIISVSYKNYSPQRIGDATITRFTAWTGLKPVILPGMTPTTATARIVAAAANAGFVAELAGGGQVTERIFARRLEELSDLLDEGRGIVFNTMYLDPYLYQLHVSRDALLFKYKREGFPFLGLTLAAGIPAAEEAVALLERLNEAGMWLNSFKAGNTGHMERILEIAEATDLPFVVQLESGIGGGHHGWHDALSLLARYYNRLREHENVLIAVGGGIATPDDAMRLFDGTWFGGPVPRPVDAVFIGTHAMVALESELSPQGKDALIKAPGLASGWLAEWEAKGGVISGTSSLGAPIYYLDNHASRVARFLARLGRSEEVIARHRDTIIRMLERTPKPYFGDYESMSYGELLRRFVQLTARGTDTRYEDPPWMDPDHRRKYIALMDRVASRFGISFEATGDDPSREVEELISRAPRMENARVLPQDADFFLHRICDAPGKPMPFVVRIDGRILKRYLSDALFYCHDPRYDADSVLMLPGPRVLVHVTEKDRPISEILERFVPTAVEDADPREIVVQSAWVMVDGRKERNPWPALTKSLKIKRSDDVWQWSAPEDGVRATLVVDRGIVRGTYLLKDARGERHEIPYIFRMEGALPVWEAGTTAEAMSRLYGSVFRDPDPEAFNALFGFAPTDDPLTLAACRALPVMTRELGGEGLLHYIARAKRLEEGRGIPSVSHRTDGAVRVEFKEEGRTTALVDGEFRKSSGGMTQPLPPMDEEGEPVYFDAPVRIGEKELQAPEDMAPFARAGGDGNPIHGDDGFARTQGLKGRIVHGLYLMGLLERNLKDLLEPSRKLTKLESRFVAPVPTGSPLVMEVERSGRRDGRHILEARLNLDGALAVEAAAEVEPPLTAYVYPGQGVQKKGMHEPAYSRSPAAREVWEKADAITREKFGFSLLEIVRDNPTTIRTADGVARHPEGVIHLTQFTQPVLVVNAMALTEELRELGAFVEGAAFSGHSLGEYAALSSVPGILSLERVVEVVYHRGLTMQNYVPRDEEGRSPYRMAVVRPHHAGMSDGEIRDLVEEIRDRTRMPLEIVNYNVRGRQYAITGRIEALEELRRALPSGRKPAYLEIPGLDVPFHSTLLRGGVEAFRTTLERTIPEEVDPALLEGRYWPNLTGTAFRLDGEYLDLVERLTGSEKIEGIRSIMNESPKKAAARLLIELLAYQFASPVQWIAIQEGLLSEGYEHIIEIGPEHQPTLRNLMAQTVMVEKPGVPPMVLHSEIDRAVVLGMVPSGDGVVAKTVLPRRQEPSSPARNERDLAPQSSAPAEEMRAQPASQEETDAADPIRLGVRTLLAYLGGFWPSELKDSTTIEDLIQGNSARRNQILADLRKEFGLRLGEDVTRMPLADLEELIRRQATYVFPGPVLREGGDDLRARLGMSVEEAISRIRRSHAITERGARSLVYALVPYVKFHRSRLTGSDSPYPEDGEELLARAAAEGLGLKGPAPKRSSQGPAGLDDGALQKAAASLLGKGGALHRMAEALREAVDPEGPPIGLRPLEREGGEPAHSVGGKFDPAKEVSFTSARNWIREDTIRAVMNELRGERDEEVLARLRRRGWDGEILEAYGDAGRSLRSQLKREPFTSVMPDRLTVHPEGTEVRWPSSHTVEPLTALITGAGPGSIAEAVASILLSLGWRVLVGSSRLDYDRVRRYASLYRHWASEGAELHVVPFDQGNYEDVDSLAMWAWDKASQGPVAVLPFGAVGMDGMAQDIGERHEKAVRVNLLGLERLVGAMAARGRIHVILPMSPNEGALGGDGVYGETKAALRALLGKATSEVALRKNASMVGAMIGWVRGTGLMGRQDSIAEAVERELGIRTFSTEEMAQRLVSLLSREVMELAERSPMVADLTGGISKVKDWGLRVARLRTASTVQTQTPPERKGNGVMPYPDTWIPSPRRVDTALDPSRIPVIVGYGEVGPYGESEARWSAEVKGTVEGIGALHLALAMGLVRYDSRKAAFVDAGTGEVVPENEIGTRYATAFSKGTGIRLRPAEGQDPDHHQSMARLTLDESVVVEVPSMQAAEKLRAHDPERISVFRDNDGRIFVRMAKGTVISAPYTEKLRNPVAGMLPDGWEFSRFGLTESQVADMDRNALMMLVATALAFESAGTTPEEIAEALGPHRIGNALGTGIGGIQNMERLYTDPVLGRKREATALQESLGNVPGSHVSQGYLGNFGPIISPVAACATAGVSLELAVEKILLGKADFMVAGSTDDIGYAGAVGFDDMGATVDWPEMEKRGIPASAVSRPHDVRRKGFVEAQGGGAILVTTLEVAMRLGLPVYAAIVGAWTHTDGYSRSVPAPGHGLVYTVAGGNDSPLARALRAFGLGGADVDVVSMHGTSTGANDPHEAKLYETILEKLGRRAPVLAVSQKALTGHPKGGAAAFQMAGAIQMFRDATVPGHRHLEELDPQERNLSRIVFPGEPVKLPDGMPRAVLITTLGFGHVGSLIALAHPSFALGALRDEEYRKWRSKVAGRLDPARIFERLAGWRPLLVLRDEDSPRPEV